MFTRTVMSLTAALLVTSATAAFAGPPVPAALQGLKPYQVVEQIMVQRDALGLTAEQFAQLDAISLAARNEKHQFTHQGGKPHNTQHVPMISRSEAFGQALAVLTPEQQELTRSLFGTPQPVERASRKLTVPHGKP